MATQAQRIDALEREVVSLRGEFAAVAAALDFVFDAGRAYQAGRTGAGGAPAHTRHLRLVPGGLEAREAEAEPELEAGA
jgi:hypothetical protein